MQVTVEYNDSLRTLVEQTVLVPQTWFTRLPRAARGVVLVAGLFAPAVLLMMALRLPIAAAVAAAVAILFAVRAFGAARRSVSRDEDAAWASGLRQSVTLHAEYLEIAAADGSWTRHDWSDISRLQLEPTLIVIHLGVYGVIPIPVFAFAARSEFDEFARLAKQSLDASRESAMGDAASNRDIAPTAAEFDAIQLGDEPLVPSAVAIAVLTALCGAAIYVVASPDPLTQAIMGAVAAVMLAIVGLLGLDLYGRCRRGRWKARRVKLALWTEGVHCRSGVGGTEWLLRWRAVAHVCPVGADAVVQSSSPLGPNLANVRRFRFPRPRQADAFCSAATAHVKLVRTSRT